MPYQSFINSKMYSMNGNDSLRTGRRDIQRLLFTSICHMTVFFLSASQQYIHSLFFTQACRVNLLAIEVILQQYLIRSPHTGWLYVHLCLQVNCYVVYGHFDRLCFDQWQMWSFSPLIRTKTEKRGL